MALQDTLDSADTQFGQYWPDVQAAQEDYMNAGGRYWQGLVTHGPPNIPLDGTAKSAVRLSEAPTDQPVTWTEFKTQHGLAFPSAWEQAVRIDSYRDEQGDGYVAIRRLVYEGSEYQKRNNVGPLSRSHDWEKQPKPASGNDAMAWESDLNVRRGQKVTYNGTTYRAIQPHRTQSTWTPDVVPALFIVIPDDPSVWQAGVAYEVGDVVTYDGTEYECIQAHTSLDGWEPPNVPALWGKV